MTVPPREGVIYVLVRGVLKQTQWLLGTRSRSTSEAYTVWVGDLDGGVGTVREAWPLEADADSRHAKISSGEVLRVGHKVSERGWYILAQLHTHGGRAFHSSTDDHYPISSQRGFLSIVVPNFGNDPPGRGWAFYEHQGGGSWRQLPANEVRRRIIMEGIWWRRLLSVIIGRASF
jgi:hypothetical protein